MGLFNKSKKNKVSELAKGILDLLDYPYIYFPKGSDYRIMMQEYQAAAVRGKSSGFTPVFVCVDPVLHESLEIMKDEGYSAGEIIQNGADAQAGQRFLKERFEEYFGDDKVEQGISLEEFIGEYSGEAERINDFLSLCGLSDQTAESILFEIPTEKPWEIAAYIPFGGWNECPEPADMVNVLKYWSEKYDAIPAVITHDTLELTVPTPVKEADALELSKEHYAFTPDRVDQGTESDTLSEVAESLKVSTVWFFWWD